MTDLINSNTFSCCLHSKDEVQFFHLNLPSNTHLSPATDVMRYGPSQLGLNFSQAGFLVFPKTFLNTKSPGANGLSFTFIS